jgi:cysteine-rich repeat protein
VPAYTLEVPLFDRDGNLVASLTHAKHRVQAPTCGNGIVEPGEDCDDGDQLDCNACDTTCHIPSCGNDILCPGEDCDDGNTTPADGCEPDCTLTPLPECVNFPPTTGSDSFNSLAVVSMSIPSLPGVNGSIFLRGPSTVTRGAPSLDVDLKRKIATTIALTLSGSSSALGDITIRESQSLVSSGQIKAQNVGSDFLADSFFDVFFEIDTEFAPPYDKLHNAVPVHLQQVIRCIPPYGSIYVPAFALTTPLLDQSNTPVGMLTHAQHRVPAPFCGNGVMNPGEACDDGNLLDCDGCDSNCTTGCGNGITCAPEQCDDANTTPGDGCEPDCTLTPAPCTGETCGNFTGTCNPSFPGQCFCFSGFAGPGGCVDDFQCGTAQSCPGGLGCPAGKVCYVGTCCGGPTCGPSTCTGVIRSVAGGPTAAGND